MTNHSNNPNHPASQEQDEGPWYKQPWAWFVLTPLITVVLVSSVTVTIAVKYADERVIDNYYKEGRLINQRLEQDKAAESLGLVGDVKFDRLVGEVFINLSATASSEPLPETLLLLLSHPTTAKQDRSVEMKKVSPGRYRGDLVSQVDYHWYLRLLPGLTKADAIESYNEAPWRLTGEIFFQKESEVALKPAQQASAQ